jgi:hypothetical protein
LTVGAQNGIYFGESASLLLNISPDQAKKLQKE